MEGGREGRREGGREGGRREEGRVKKKVSYDFIQLQVILLL